MDLISRAPHPTLPEHPAFILMVAATLERFHCTLGEVREDYWLGRAWRALAGDPQLAGRVARMDVGSVLITGPDRGAAPGGAEAEGWRRHVNARILADTAHTAASLGIAIRFAAGPVQVREGRSVSLLAQTVAGDSRWGRLEPYAGDLAPVQLPVAQLVTGVVAA